MLVADSISGVPTEVIANADAVTGPVVVSEPVITALPLNGNPDPDTVTPLPDSDNTVTAPLPLAFTSKSFENVIVLIFENGTPLPSNTVIAAVAVSEEVGKNAILLPLPPITTLPCGTAKLGAFATYKSFAVIVVVEIRDPVIS
jgi:hypothetical protein